MTLLVRAAAALASPDFLIAMLGPSIGLTAGPVAGRLLGRVLLGDARRALAAVTLGLLFLVLGGTALIAGVPLLALNPVASVGFCLGQVLGLTGGVGLSVGTSLHREVIRAGRAPATRLAVRTERI